MSKNANDLWDIIVGNEKLFTNLEMDEAFSALFAVACHYEGVAMFEGEIIGRFNG